MKSFWRRIHPAWWVVLALLVAVRAVLPSVILGQLNKTLASLDGPLCGHLEDLDLAILRGRYQLEGLVMRTREGQKCEKEILRVRRIDISLAWAQLIRGKARLRTHFYEPALATDELIAALSPGPGARKEAKESAQSTWNALVPWRIDSARMYDGRITFQLFGKGGISTALDEAEGEVTGIESNFAHAQPILFRAKGRVFGGATAVAAGSVSLAPEPLRWEVDISAEDVDITKANPFLLNRVPLTFTSGKVSVYSEAIGAGETAEGYAKLLFANMDVVSGKEKWKNFTQGVLEILNSFFFIIAKNEKSDTVGTEIIFRKSAGALSVDWTSALARAFEHQKGQRVPPGIENRLVIPPLEKETK